MKITANDGKTYTLPTNPVWHNGPPPDIGWWPASSFRSIFLLRYWDGHNWSVVVSADKGQNVAANAARKIEVYNQRQIEWADRWWLKGGK